MHIAVWRWENRNPEGPAELWEMPFTTDRRRVGHLGGKGYVPPLVARKGARSLASQLLGQLVGCLRTPRRDAFSEGCPVCGSVCGMGRRPMLYDSCSVGDTVSLVGQLRSAILMGS